MKNEAQAFEINPLISDSSVISASSASSALRFLMLRFQMAAEIPVTDVLRGGLADGTTYLINSNF